MACCPDATFSFQDGQQMEDTYIEGSQTKKTESVEPGLTMSGIEEAFLTNSENEIEIEFTHYLDKSSGKVLIISDFPVE